MGVKAGLAYTLSEAADDGHCYLPENVLVADATKILGVAERLITPLIPDLAAEELAVRRLDDAAAQPPLHRHHPRGEPATP